MQDSHCYPLQRWSGHCEPLIADWSLPGNSGRCTRHNWKLASEMAVCQYQSTASLKSTLEPRSAEAPVLFLRQAAADCSSYNLQGIQKPVASKMLEKGSNRSAFAVDRHAGLVRL